jgi:hypothetical protein
VQGYTLKCRLHLYILKEIQGSRFIFKYFHHSAVKAKEKKVLKHANDQNIPKQEGS